MNAYFPSFCLNSLVKYFILLDAFSAVIVMQYIVLV